LFLRSPSGRRRLSATMRTLDSRVSGVATRVTTRPPSPSRSSQFPSKAVCFSLFRLFVGGLLTVYLAHLSNTSHALPHNFSTLQHPLPCLQSFLSPSKSPAVAPPSLKETKAANEAKSAIPTFPPFEYASVFNSDKQYGDFRDDIVKKGYAVIPALSVEKALSLRDQAHSWVEGFERGYKRDDPSTFTVQKLPVSVKGGAFSPSFSPV
jgi:hypothetical protein